ncbi:phosphatase PAP2 family protein [Bacillus sp. z60-18]|uniref:phosphatase PAP2 family protein n=1 Tax=Bacillus TaxID=1386 RepID=UPI00098A90A6|nr:MULTISPECIES: phosphatase PAP2 family protein [Bacillus]WFA03373.1 phosphatase PAP2 family protein [Bacillus sp. HSf4]
MRNTLIFTALFLVMAALIRVPAVQLIDVHIAKAAAALRQPLLTPFFKAMTGIGSSGLLLTVMLVLTLLLAYRKKAAASLYVYLLFLLERTVNEGLKDWISRPRPEVSHLVHETSFSFPSGHSMNAASMYPFIAYILLLHIPFFKKHRTAVLVWTGLVTILIGISRIYLGVHYTTDVIAGFSLGLALFFLFKKIGENYPLVRQN